MKNVPLIWHVFLTEKHNSTILYFYLFLKYLLIGIFASSNIISLLKQYIILLRSLLKLVKPFALDVITLINELLDSINPLVILLLFIKVNELSISWYQCFNNLDRLIKYSFWDCLQSDIISSNSSFLLCILNIVLNLWYCSFSSYVKFNVSSICNNSSKVDSPLR